MDIILSLLKFSYFEEDCYLRVDTTLYCYYVSAVEACPFKTLLGFENGVDQRGGFGFNIKYLFLKHMGQTRQEVKRPKKHLFFSTSDCSPDMILFTLRLQMVSIQQIRRRHQFKTFVRSVALVELG